MQLGGATIAVTGATGFLGRYLVDLLLRRGARVVGVVRNPDRVPELRERGVELRRADLAERDRLAAGFRGADAVVSNAALLSLRTQRWADYVQTNVDGTVERLRGRGGGRRPADRVHVVGQRLPGPPAAGARRGSRPVRSPRSGPDA